MARSASEAANAGETTPLLASDNSNGNGNGQLSATQAVAKDPLAPANPKPSSSAPPSPEDKPLPVAQILFLCYIRIVEPIAFFGIFPFVPQMVQRIGHIAPDDVGFYSGLIESLFSVTQMCVMIAWGRASDRYGRKPVLVFSVAGVSIATAAFGFATTLWQMILFRCIAGVFAGTIVTIRTMISEHSTTKTQARSFSYFAFSGNIGISLGPLLGGVLAEPAHQYGGFWKNIPFFTAYPYALATIVAGLFGITATLVGIFFVEETLPPSSRVGALVPDSTSTNDPDSASPTKPQPATIRGLLRSPGVPVVLYLYGHVMLLAFAYTAICPVFWYTSRSLGGFGFSPLYNSLFMGLAGASQAIWLLLVFPPLQRRLGTRSVLRVCAFAYPFFIATPPLLTLLVRPETGSQAVSQAREIAFWVLAPTLLSIGSGISMSFTGLQLALNDVSPDPKSLALLNSMALGLTSGVRAFTPVASASLYAVGVKKQIFGGELAWVVLIGVTLLYTVGTAWLPKSVDDRVHEVEDDS